MAIKILRGFQIGNQFLYTGRFYLFDYSRFENDPQPLGLFMNVHWGISEDTGHMHQFLQMINFHYLPVIQRPIIFKRWMEINKDEAFAKKNFTRFWTKLQQRMPAIDFSVRRYLVNPPGLIRNIRHLDNEFLTKYFSNPIQLIARAQDTAERVILQAKMKAMRVKRTKKR